MTKPKTIFINGSSYEISTGLNFHPTPKDKYMTRYKFFEVRDVYRGGSKIAANYGDYWAIGENFYDAADRLESKMFAENRFKFIKIIDSKLTGKSK